MKKSISLIILIFVTLFFTNISLIAQSFGNAYAHADFAELNLGSDVELQTTVYNYVENSNGSYSVNAIWYLSEGNMFIPVKGINKVSIMVYLNSDGSSGDPFIGVLGLDSEGDGEIQVEAEAIINKHGKCHVVFHINGNK